MSEINSIANGTFTIGQTSATSFEAGPGISITQPSAGTVRIANDETVLFSGYLNMPGNSLVLSEPASAFEHTIIYYTNNDGFQSSVDFIPKTDVIYGPCLNAITQWSNGNTYFKTLTLTSNDTKTYNAWTSASQIVVNTTAGISYSFNNSNLLKIQKVVGINRISGSNA